MGSWAEGVRETRYSRLWVEVVGEEVLLLLLLASVLDWTGVVERKRVRVAARGRVRGRRKDMYAAGRRDASAIVNIKKMSDCCCSLRLFTLLVTIPSSLAQLSVVTFRDAAPEKA